MFSTLVFDHAKSFFFFFLSFASYCLFLPLSLPSAVKSRCSGFTDGSSSSQISKNYGPN